MTNNSNEKKAINKFRVWITEFRTESNNLCDKYLKRLDEWELKLAKEVTANPIQISFNEGNRSGQGGAITGIYY